MSVSNTKERWPFLFTARGMNYHFKNLTGIDLRDKVTDFSREECNVLIEYLACKNDDQARTRRDMLRAERNGHSSTKLPTAVLMLVKALKDDLSFFVTFVEVSVCNVGAEIACIYIFNLLTNKLFVLLQSTTSFEEVAAVANFPPRGTPILIAAGNKINIKAQFCLHRSEKSEKTP